MLQMTRFRLFLILIAIGSVLGCDFVYRMLHKEGAQEKAIVGEVVPPEKNPAVEDVQNLLKLYGYELGEIDGVLGPKTRDAIKRFQSDNGLNPTRFVDQPTWEKLSVFKDNGLVVDNQLNVTLVQTLLKSAGENPGTVDGKMGVRTRTAVESFQTKAGLKADGKVGYKTLTKLAEYLK